MSEDNHHQQLMNAAYAKWQADGDLEGKSIDEFHAALPTDQLKAVYLGNLNYQVGNGGFEQWVDNGYACDADEIMALLKEMGTELSTKVHAMIGQLLPHLDCGGGRHGSYWEQEEEEHEDTCGECNGSNEIWIEDKEDDEAGEEGGHYDSCNICDGGYERWTENVDSCEGQRIARELDRTYYKFNEAFMEEVNRFLLGEELVKVVKAKVATIEVKTKPRVKLIGKEGNAFYILGKVKEALSKAGMPNEAKKFTEEATSGNYNHLLATAMKYVSVY